MVRIKGSDKSRCQFGKASHESPATRSSCSAWPWSKCTLTLKEHLGFALEPLQCCSNLIGTNVLFLRGEVPSGALVFVSRPRETGRAGWTARAHPQAKSRWQNAADLTQTSCWWAEGLRKSFLEQSHPLYDCVVWVISLLCLLLLDSSLLLHSYRGASASNIFVPKPWRLCPSPAK